MTQWDIYNIVLQISGQRQKNSDFGQAAVCEPGRLIDHKLIKSFIQAWIDPWQNEKGCDTSQDSVIYKYPMEHHLHIHGNS